MEIGKMEGRMRGVETGKWGREGEGCGGEGRGRDFGGGGEGRGK